MAQAKILNGACGFNEGEKKKLLTDLEKREVVFRKILNMNKEHCESLPQKKISLLI